MGVSREERGSAWPLVLILHGYFLPVAQMASFWLQMAPVCPSDSIDDSASHKAMFSGPRGVGTYPTWLSILPQPPDIGSYRASRLSSCSPGSRASPAVWQPSLLAQSAAGLGGLPGPGPSYRLTLSSAWGKLDLFLDSQSWAHTWAPELLSPVTSCLSPCFTPTDPPH